MFSKLLAELVSGDTCLPVLRWGPLTVSSYSRKLQKPLELVLYDSIHKGSTLVA